MIYTLFDDVLTGAIVLFLWTLLAKLFRVLILDDSDDGGAIILSFVGALLLTALAASFGHLILELK